MADSRGGNSAAKDHAVPQRWTPTGRRDFIIEHTRVSTSWLCPEISLRLITEACPLWRATEADLVRLGLPDPYWGFCWGGGQALVRYLLDHPGSVAGKRVLVFGSGCGIEAIAACKAGASRVLAADIDPFSTEATLLNAALNAVALEVTTEDLLGSSLTGFDVLLAGDMFYDPVFSKRVLEWFSVLASRGMVILLADPGRGNLAGYPLQPLGSYQVPSDIDLSGKFLRQATVYGFAKGRLDERFKTGTSGVGEQHRQGDRGEELGGGALHRHAAL